MLTEKYLSKLISKQVMTSSGKHLVLALLCPPHAKLIYDTSWFTGCGDKFLNKLSLNV